jgi:glycosyltransferase involved in cell wall biosynthesis
MPARILFLVTEDWYFVSHRLPLAVAALEAGYEVIVATRVSSHGDVIRNAGLQLVPFQLSRRRGNPFTEIAQLVRLYQKVRPTIVHHVALKAVVYGSIAARIAGVENVVNAVAGLGWLFASSSHSAKVLRPLVRAALGFLLSSTRSIVQNPDDFLVLEAAGVPGHRMSLIRGAGVDTTLFFPNPPPPMPVMVVLVARMLWDKGVGEFVEAARILHREGVAARFVLVGDADLENPACVPEAKLKSWRGQNGVEWWGRRDDIPCVLRQAHVACLPSYREGLPKSLLEAAASGLPLVATDTPGCREVVLQGQNGLLVPPRDAAALARALRELIQNAVLRQSMGSRSRALAVESFSQRYVIEQTLDLYRTIVEQTGERLQSAELN